MENHGILLTVIILSTLIWCEAWNDTDLNSKVFNVEKDGSRDILNCSTRSNVKNVQDKIYMGRNLIDMETLASGLVSLKHR